MDKYDKMLNNAREKYNYSELEENMIKNLLDTCNAEDVEFTSKGMFEVLFKCDAIPNRTVTTCDCETVCERYGCSTCSAVGDAECLINCEKGILDFDTDELYFENEIKEIVRKYYAGRNDKISDTEFDMLMKEISQEMNCILKRREII
ncbi:MAG: hypothetical protein IJQ28_07735 [Clostridia bacterium]|nr:hypothetical protein [Clostridia bacterium]